MFIYNIKALPPWYIKYVLFCNIECITYETLDAENLSAAMVEGNPWQHTHRVLGKLILQMITNA